MSAGSHSAAVLRSTGPADLSCVEEQELARALNANATVSEQHPTAQHLASPPMAPPSPRSPPSIVAHPRITHSQSLHLPTTESVASPANGHAEVQSPHRRATTGQMFNEAAPKDRIDVINDYLREQTTIRPLIGIVCGSGLGGLSKCLTKTETVKYEDIPHFPRSTVEGHAGELVFGWLDKYPVVCMRGRFHSYEGYEMRETALPIRVMYLLGIKYLIVTNAAGGLNAGYSVGDIMIMNDHLNMPGLAGKHPLVGPNDARFGQRFTPMSDCYDRKLQGLAYATAERLQLTHRVRQKGVYCFVSGPTYETPTECRLLRLVGGDAVGMSTVPEVIVATHCGVKVLGLSLITNKVIYPGDEGHVPASHEEVLEATQMAQRDIESFVRELIFDIGEHHSA